MGQKKTDSFERHSSVLVGAIFMCNRRTKKECLGRKLFGFPYNQADFVKKVKAGMVLFLFEYEERKLHGVFEATSDGAQNIVPAAFSSSGRLYPSQIRFRRTWSCKPLSEDEFCHAIEENYYEPFKFHFGLTYKQVSKLIYLFSLKKTSVQPYWEATIPNKMEQQFEGTVRGTRSVRLNSHEQHKSILTSENSADDSRHGLFQKVPYGGTKSLFGSMFSESQNDSSLKSNLSSTFYDQFHNIPSHGVDLSSSITQGIVGSFYKDPTAYPRLSTGTHMPPIRNQSPIQSDLNTLNILPASSFQSTFLLNSEEVKRDTSFPVYESARISTLDQGYTSHATLQDNQAYSPDYYIPPVVKSAPVNKIVAPKGIETFLPLVESSGNSNHLAAEMEYTVRGQQHHNVGSAPDYIPLSLEYDDFCDSKIGIDYEEDPAPDLLIMHGENYRHPQPVANSRLQSDFEQRKSVFTRLSSVPRPTRQSNIRHEYEAGPSVDQILSIISQRRELWAKTFGTTVDVSNIISWDEEDVPETTSEKELNKADFDSELDSSSEAVAEECIQLLFRDFKRRSSKVQKMKSGSGMHETTESNKDEGSQRKRRRLVRPSFNEEEHQSMHTEHKSVQISAGIIESVPLVKEDELRKDEHFQTGEENQSVHTEHKSVQISAEIIETGTLIKEDELTRDEHFQTKEEHQSMHTEHKSVEISTEIIESGALVKEDELMKDEHFQTENSSSANIPANNLEITSKELETCKNDVSGGNTERLSLEPGAQHPTISVTLSVGGTGADAPKVRSSWQSVLQGESDICRGSSEMDLNVAPTLVADDTRITE
ncbi:uncharacterized protein LOC109713513 isoform X2 [Ananas comosus]|uniref:Uncharacterized protein LOC109713513 isoform X2 n=1 Tax=Ananas comosus TaxID=4615 RepID=A0A6P5FJ60_ANACO|nr:uncharacterized protein LOC109713513 isoform X2 [Ananas comosus]